MRGNDSESDPFVALDGTLSVTLDDSLLSRENTFAHVLGVCKSPESRRVLGVDELFGYKLLHISINVGGAVKAFIIKNPSFL